MGLRGLFCLVWIASVLLPVNAIFKGAPKIKPFSWPTDTLVGEAVASVTCTATKGQMPLHFNWLKNGQQLSADNVRVHIRLHEKFSTLEILNLNSNDHGNYSCSVKNAIGSDSFSSPLEIKESPKWAQEPKDVSVLLGEKVSVSCKSVGFPEPKVVWRSLDQKDRELSLLGDSLVIESVSLSDEGKYECEANNRIGRQLKKVIAIHVFVPAKFEEKVSVMTVKKGESIKMDCSAKGDQPMTISWVKESSKLNKSRSERYEIFESLTNEGIKSELVIRSAERIDGGLYLCIAENGYGKDEKSNKLLVLEAPGAPTNLVLREVWSRSASISWSWPFAGNSPITGYVIQYWRESHSGENKRLQEEEVTSSQTSVFVNGLEPGTSYELKVVAKNGVGRGSPSNVIRLKTGEEEPSGPPLDVVAEAKGSTTVRVSWKSPPKEKWNGDLLGFYVGFRLTSDYKKPFSLRTVAIGNSNYSYEYFLSGLNKGSEYTIVVKAFNLAGSGPESQEMVVKTISGELPPPPRVYIITMSTDAVGLLWKLKLTPVTKISGFSIHYKPQYASSWKEVSIPVGLNRDEGEYLLKDLEANTIYSLYVTAINNYGHGDPSQLLAIKTRAFGEESSFTGTLFSSNDNLNLMTFQQDMVSVISMTIAVVVVIVVIIIAFVCIRKAQIEGSKPPLDLCSATLPRVLEADKSGAYMGGTLRYVDFDNSRNLMQGNVEGMVPGNVPMGYHPTPYSTLPMREDLVGQVPEEMKSFVPQTPKPWERPLPVPNGQSSSKRKSTSDSSNIYDFPQ